MWEQLNKVLSDIKGSDEKKKMGTINGVIIDSGSNTLALSRLRNW